MKRCLLALAALCGCTVANPDFCDHEAGLCADAAVNVLDVAVTADSAAGHADARLADARPAPPDASLPDAPPPDAFVADVYMPDANVVCGDAGTCPGDVPICRRGLCGTCALSSECPTGQPICQGSGACGGCTGESDCTPRTLTPHCATMGPMSGACVGCRGLEDCALNKPVCSTATSTCALCTVETDCQMRPETPHCLLNGGPTKGSCVECRSIADCNLPAMPACSNFTCQKCTMDNDCAARPGIGRCDRDNGVCVQCNLSSECPAQQPVCDSHACRVCQADSDCDSDACDLATGRCLAATEVIYVDAAGSVSSLTCSQADPCPTFTAGLALVTGTRKRMNVKAGTYAEKIDIQSLTVDIFAAGAVVASPVVNTPAVAVHGGKVSIKGLTVRDTLGTAGGNLADGIACGSGANLQLAQVKVTASSAQGVDATSCTLTMDRVLLLANNGGGLLVGSGSSFAVTNSFIVQNGTPSSAFGGVKIASASGTFDFNTVADNVAIAGTVPGVICPNTAMTCDSDIVALNGNGDQVSGCTWTYSDITPNIHIPAGDHNVASDPQFVGGGDHHLMPTSPCVNNANPGNTSQSHDFDGDVRPAPGTTSDCGADEYTP